MCRYLTEITTTTASANGASNHVAPKKLSLRNRQEEQRMQSIILDSLTAIAVGYAFYKYPGYFNPWGLSLVQWMCGFVGMRSGIFSHDIMMSKLLVQVVWGGKEKLLPTRTTGKPVPYVPLDTKAVIFLVINCFNEYVFLSRLTHFLWHSPDVPLRWEELNMLNSLGALVVILVVFDLIFAPIHHILHLPWLYPLIHKHHHRQHFPVLGYWDAASVHVIEQFMGLSATWGAILVATHGPTGAHGIALFLFFNIHAVLNLLNHSRYDVEFDIIPGIMTYKAGNHEMHHRKFTVNYASYNHLYDHLMGTYAPYEGPSSAAGVEKKKES
ncbi:C-5 sterol desaturase [Seminavis robusta]|uniref:C-5 sterol desaturase n=1 Tax=Seminavis robusta TaxID=568900 RepID=A0A9N8HA60_9STRA|nr:C-5 sterol desaturase [Seminavis robusta]|eukprot:Sro214_g088670.1 C-5 sterol desaturase (326) ;mRNA; r:18756-19733